jgi:hypothetical protein
MVTRQQVARLEERVEQLAVHLGPGRTQYVVWLNFQGETDAEFSGAILMREPRMVGAEGHTCICGLGTFLPTFFNRGIWVCGMDGRTAILGGAQHIAASQR